MRFISANAVRLGGFLVAALLFHGAAAPAALAQGAAPLQSQDTHVQGVVAELLECSRKEGVLTVKVRFRSASDAKPWFAIDTHHGAYDGFYVIAGNKKHFILKDAEGAPLAPKYLGGVNLGKGDSHNWWAKFPAPPADVKRLKLVIPQLMPFEDVPVTDK